MGAHGGGGVSRRISREKLIQMQQVLRAKERDAQMKQAQYQEEERRYWRLACMVEERLMDDYGVDQPPLLDDWMSLAEKPGPTQKQVEALKK